MNLPLVDALSGSQRILLAGAGGGYDIFAALPLYMDLKDKTIFWANYNAYEPDLHAEHIEYPADNLRGISASSSHPLPYSPENCLANWFLETQNIPISVWQIQAEGLAPTRRAYQYLVKQLQIDTIVLVDGGVDSLVRGDEDGTGTFLEDAVSVGAVAATDVPTKILACLGFGTEKADGLSHLSILENIATLTQQQAFYGSCALMNSNLQFYESALKYAQAQPEQSISKVNRQILAASQGEFGIFMDERYFLSPLMSLYWFFDLQQVAQNSYFLPEIQDTTSLDEVLSAYIHFKNRVPRRKN